MGGGFRNHVGKDGAPVGPPHRAGRITCPRITVGGIITAVKINAVAEAGEGETIVGSMDESVLSIAAGPHGAVAFRPMHAADLDEHLDPTADPAHGGLTIPDGSIIPAGAPEVGVEVKG